MHEAPTPARSPVPPWVDPLLVLGGTVAFVAWVRALGYDGWPLGDGWNRYLGNAVAIAEGDWGAYLRWRGPGHAWLCLALLPLTGSLVVASQWLSTAATAALFPLTWGLGRVLLGRAPALAAMLLLAAWPDLRLFAWMSSPYPLEGALVGGGALLAAAAVGRTRTPAAGLGALGGLLLGFACVTDPRGAAATAAIALALAAAGERERREPLWAALALVMVAGGLALGLPRLLPVELYPLAKQIALQRDHAAPLAAACVARGDAPPTLADLVGPCGQAMWSLNRERAGAWTPLSPWLPLGLAAAGLFTWRERLWRVLLPALPLLTLAPSLFLVPVQHRYLVPFAPFAAVLVAAGLHRLARLGRHPALPAAGPLVALAFALLWQLHGPSLLTRADAGPRGAGATASLSVKGPVVRAAELVRAGWVEGEVVLDCANGNLRERLHPIPAEPLKGGPGCQALLTTPRPHTWLFVRPGPGAAAAPAWEVVMPATQPGAPSLLHAR